MNLLTDLARKTLPTFQFSHFSYLLIPLQIGTWEFFLIVRPLSLSLDRPKVSPVGRQEQSPSESESALGQFAVFFLFATPIVSPAQ